MFVRECTSSIKVVRKLTTLRGEYHDRIRQARKSGLLAKIIDRLFGEPAVTLKLVSKAFQISPPAAQRAIDTLVAEGILTEVTGGQRNRVYVAEDVISNFSRELRSSDA